METNHPQTCESTQARAIVARMGNCLLRTAIALTLTIPLLLGSCKKNDEGKSSSNASIHTAHRDGDDGPLEDRIIGFYATMKGLHDNNGTSSTIMSKDSTEFLIEAAYNYEVARSQYENLQQNGTFNFTVASGTAGELTESDVSKCMYRIKDSLMAIANSIYYTDKQLSLFDLTLLHGGTGRIDTVVVDYAFTSGAKVLTLHPKDPTVIYGDPTFAYAAMNIPCGNASIWSQPYYFPQFFWSSPYYSGTATLDFTNNTIASGTQNCSNYGAAAILRTAGISNYYYATTGTLNSPPNLIVNIQNQTTMPVNNTVNHDYYNRGIASYQKSDQYWTTADVNTSGIILASGNYFFDRWLNVPMMNHYLGYIAGKIISNIPAGKTFKDFQLAFRTPANIGPLTSLKYQYYYFYGNQSKIPVPTDSRTGVTGTSLTQLSDF